MIECRPRLACIDDEESNLNYLKEILNPHYEVDVFKSPLEFLKNSKTYDCYLIDLHMPVINGMSLMKKIVNNPAYGLEPIVLITSDSSPITKTESFKEGALTYLDRYISNGELLSVLKSKTKYYKDRQTILQTGNLSINTQTFNVTIDQESLDLSILEFKFLKTVISQEKMGIKLGDMAGFHQSNGDFSLSELTRKLSKWNHHLIVVNSGIEVVPKIEN